MAKPLQLRQGAVGPWNPVKAVWQACQKFDTVGKARPVP
jgi:hypothetical protein